MVWQSKSQAVGMLITLILILGSASHALPASAHSPESAAKVEILVDDTGLWTAADVIAKRQLFQDPRGFTLKRRGSETIWLWISLSLSDFRGQSLVLALDAPGASGVQLFEFSPEGVVHNLSGQRLATFRPEFAVDRPDGPLPAYLIRLTSLHPGWPGVHIETPSNHRQEIWLSFTVGFIIALLGIFGALIERRELAFWLLKYSLAAVAMVGLSSGASWLLAGDDSYTRLVPIAMSITLVNGICYLFKSHILQKRWQPSGIAIAAVSFSIVAVTLLLVLGGKSALAVSVSELLFTSLFAFGLLFTINAAKAAGESSYFRVFPWAAGFLGCATAFVISGIGIGETYSNDALTIGVFAFGCLEWINRFWQREQAMAQTILDLREARDQVAAATQESARRAEEQQAHLMLSTKMRSLSEMAGGMAHEINNPLAVIQGYVENIVLMAESGHIDIQKMGTFAGKITHSVNRISKIILGLRAIGRQAENDPFGIENVAGIIQSTLDLCQSRFLNLGVKLTIADIPADLWLECRGVQITQVVTSLLNNAFDAVCNLTERWVRVEVRDLHDELEIIVVDSGSGISKEVAMKIFDPFFTTKGVGQGTGLGLSVAKGIIENHKGKLFLDFDSSNTCFVIHLPKEQNTSSEKIYVFR